MKFNQKLSFISIENKVAETGQFKDKPYFLLKLFDEETNQLYSFFIVDKKDLAETLLSLVKHDIYEFEFLAYRGKYGWEVELKDVIS